MEVRRSVFGRQGWYPEDPDLCLAAIKRFIRDLPEPADDEPRLHGGIVPHAGWHFSGKIAAGVFHHLSRQRPDTIVVYGMHLGPGSAIHMMDRGAWETPLGLLEIDGELAGPLLHEFKVSIETADYHRQDNTIELQLPLIKHFFPEAKILPVGAPPKPETLALAERVAELATAQGKKILAVGSTDLTHYGVNYGFTPAGSGPEAVGWVREKNDALVIERLLALDPEGVIETALKNSNACCPGAAAAAVRTALKLGATSAQKLTYATSNEIAPGASFVGYVGLVF